MIAQILKPNLVVVQVGVTLAGHIPPSVGDLVVIFIVAYNNSVVHEISDLVELLIDLSLQLCNLFFKSWYLACKTLHDCNFCGSILLCLFLNRDLGFVKQ